jgi:hypothetical protein
MYGVIGSLLATTALLASQHIPWGSTRESLGLWVCPSEAGHGLRQFSA